jgi:short-subunit dehydrogenase
MQLSGAHVLVTGASRGIGAHIADGVAERGATVTVVARSAEALSHRPAAATGQVLPCDLTDPAQRAGLVERAEQGVGRPLDVLVNCAGVDEAAGLLDVHPEQMRQLYEVNLLAPAELVRQALPGMVARRRGHLVTVSSGFSTVTGPGLTPYASSKAGLSHFHAGVRLELRGSGVGTTLVEPGPVGTDMYDRIESHGLAAAALNRFVRLQLTRVVAPQAVAAQVLDAVEQGRRHVVPSRRMTPVLAFTWLPRRVADVVLTGVPRR